MKPAAVQIQRGFTLIELAIVLTIIGIVIGMSTEMTISVTATAHLTATQRKMKTINDALMQFRTATDRLPCPGDLTIAPGSANYGLEAGAGSGSAIAVGTGVCTGTGMLPVANHTAAGATNTSATGAEGALPAVTLGLPPDFMLDGWGNKIRYAVDIAYTAKGVFASVGAACTNGAITVKDASENARSTGSVYALISHGANGHGAYIPSGATVNAGSSSADELTNCHCTSAGAYNSAYAPTYVQKAPAYDSGEAGVAAYYYDDLVSYKERWQMRTDWDKTNGCSYIYVADDGNNRIQVFTTSGAFVRGIGAGYNGVSGSIGSSGSGNGQLYYPFGIAIDSSGNIWVTDWGNSRVQEFSSSGAYLSQFGSGGSSAGLFNDPSGIAIDASGNVWVLNFNTSGTTYTIQKFSSSGTYLTGFGGAGVNQPWQPTSLNFDSGGNLWVTEPNGGDVQEWSSSGSYITQLLGNNPSGAAVDASGNVWVSDYPSSVTYEMQKFNTSGSVLSTFGSSGSANGQFNFSGGIGGIGPVAIDASGNLWVVDSGNNRVQEFNSSGTFLLGIGAGYNGVSGSVGSSGTGTGQFHAPTGIAIR